MKVNVLAKNTSTMSREEWLDLRRNGIGGSDAAAILGLNPHSSAFSVYMDKLGLSSPVEENEAMWLGTQLEPVIAKRFEQESGMTVQRRNQIFQHPEHPWMLANIDRWVISQKAGLEIKTTNLLNRTAFAHGEIPPNYYVQCLHYMAVTGAKEWFLAVCVVGRSFHIFHLQRSEPEIAALIEAEREFWQDHVLVQNPPLPDGSEQSGLLMRQLYPNSHNDGILVPLYGQEELIKQILMLDSQIQQLEQDSDSLKQQLQLEIGDADGGKAQGYTVWWRSQRKTSFDSKRLQAEQTDLYQQYIRSTTFRKFEIKKDKEMSL